MPYTIRHFILIIYRNTKSQLASCGEGIEEAGSSPCRFRRRPSTAYTRRSVSDTESRETIFALFLFAVALTASAEAVLSADCSSVRSSNGDHRKVFSLIVTTISRECPRKKTEQGYLFKVRLPLRSNCNKIRARISPRVNNLNSEISSHVGPEMILFRKRMCSHPS